MRKANARAEAFPRAAVALLSGASALLSMHGDLQRAVESVDRAVEVAERTDEIARLGAVGTRAIARLSAGDSSSRAGSRSARRLDPFAVVRRGSRPHRFHPAARVHAARARNVGGRLGDARSPRLRPRGSSGSSASSASHRPSTPTSTGAPGGGPTRVRTRPSTSSRTPPVSPATRSSGTRCSRASRRVSDCTNRRKRRPMPRSRSRDASACRCSRSGPAPRWDSSR